jgi:hypothetical protein
MYKGRPAGLDGAINAESAPIGLLINFHELSLKDGIHRLMLPGSSGESSFQNH